VRLVDLGDVAIAERDIRSIDLTDVEALRITVHAHDRAYVVTGPKAVDVLMRLCPVVFEGRRMRFVRHAWAVHNLIGHPMLQALAWLGLTKLGMRVHDATAPRPRITSRTSL
jgi:hypothetical protein